MSQTKTAAPLGTALTREDILNARPPAPVRVNVPELGGHVFVRVLTGAQRDAWEIAFSEAREKQLGEKKKGEARPPVNLRAHLLAAAVCDEAGKAIFDADDLEDLGKTRADVVQRLYDKATKLNAVSVEDVDELEGN